MLSTERSRPAPASEIRFELDLDRVAARVRGDEAGIIDAELDVGRETPVHARLERERVTRDRRPGDREGEKARREHKARWRRP